MLEEESSPHLPKPKSVIETRDLFCLRSAMGWLELGMPSEARKELQSLSPALAKLPEVCGVHWSILAREEKWIEAEKLARDQVSEHPDNVSNWINWAYSLRRADGFGIRVSYKTLRRAVDRFPKDSLIPYNLACYCSCMKIIDEAWKWLDIAAKRSDYKTIRKMALQDDDLQSIHDQLADWSS